MIYLPDTAAHRAEQLAEQIRSTVEANLAVVENGVYELSLTVSIGLLSVDRFDEELQAHPKAYMTRLFARVDEALYEAKKNGRNRIVRAEMR